MRKRNALFAALSLTAVFGLVAAACGDDDDSGGSSEATTTTAASGGETTTTAASGGGMTGEGKSVGLLYDITGRGDQSFNDAAAAGLDKAKSEFPELTATESTPSGENDRAERLKLLIDQDNGLIIGVGFLWGDQITEGAKANPDTSFGIVDSVVDQPNTSSLVFAEQEGSYLVGVAAAKKSTTGNIGFIGGVENDLIKKFEAGYTAGAKSVNPDIEVQVKYITQPPDFSGFNDAAKGKEIALSMYGAGADVIYAAAGASGLGVFQAAKEVSADGEKVWGIGVDSDQWAIFGTSNPDLQEFVLTSMLKRVDVATYETIADYVNGSFKPGTRVFDLKSDGVGYATSGGYVDDIKADLEQAKQDIIDGKVTVPTTPGS